MSIKFLVWRGGGAFWGLGGGVPILFLWARGFFWHPSKPHPCNMPQAKNSQFLQIYESEMGSANRGTAIAPQSTIGTRYGNSVSTASMPPQPTSKLSLKWLAIAENQGEMPIRNFSVDPASSIRTSIADPVFADPVSERLLHDLW